MKDRVVRFHCRFGLPADRISDAAYPIEPPLHLRTNGQQVFSSMFRSVFPKTCPQIEVSPSPVSVVVAQPTTSSSRRVDPSFSGIAGFDIMSQNDNSPGGVTVPLKVTENASLL